MENKLTIETDLIGLEDAIIVRYHNGKTDIDNNRIISTVCLENSSDPVYYFIYELFDLIYQTYDGCCPNEKEPVFVILRELLERRLEDGKTND